MEIVLPKSVKEVGARAFYRCVELKSAQMNEGLEKLGAKEVSYGVEYEGEVFHTLR